MAPTDCYMTHAMIVREAAPTDHEAMSALCEQVDALHAEARPDVFCDPPTPGRSVAYFDSRREAQGAAAFVAELDPDTPGRKVRLPGGACRRTAVPAQRSRRSAHATVEDWARNRQVARLELTAWEFNRGAIEFYQALGSATNYRRMGRNLSE
jgi:hypothetical protein